MRELCLYKCVCVIERFTILIMTVVSCEFHRNLGDKFHRTTHTHTHRVHIKMGEISIESVVFITVLH